MVLHPELVAYQHLACPCLEVESPGPICPYLYLGNLGRLCLSYLCRGNPAPFRQYLCLKNPHTMGTYLFDKTGINLQIDNYGAIRP
jgi:hypothetical protein